MKELGATEADLNKGEEVLVTGGGEFERKDEEGGERSERVEANLGGSAMMKKNWESVCFVNDD